MRIFLVLITVALWCNNAPACEDKLLIEKFSQQEWTEFLSMIAQKQPWSAVKNFCQEHRIDINNEGLFLGERLLTFFMLLEHDSLAYDLLDEETIDVAYKSWGRGHTPLFDAIVHYKDYLKKGKDVTLCVQIIKKIAKKNCSMNQLIAKYSAFGQLYGHPEETVTEVIDNKERISHVLIKNSAQLMIKSGVKNRWNILDKHLQYLDCCSCSGCFNSPNVLPMSEQVVKDAFYTKFQVDYKNYCKGKDRFTLALICNRLKKEKNIFVPKWVVRYIAKFITGTSFFYVFNPVEHIEETIKDAWGNAELKLEEAVKVDIKREHSVYYKEMFEHISPNVWEYAWNKYSNENDRSEINLVVKALNYKTKKKNK